MCSAKRHLLLEVERKFSPGTNFHSRIAHKDGRSPFHDILCLGQTSFEDTYYDHQNNLSSKGIWLRARDGRWQAKVRISGDFVNSQFEEIDQHSKILEMIRINVPEVNPETSHFGLAVLARFKTFRQSWLADKKFKIVHDSTDFGHEVGEVELERWFQPDAHDEQRKRRIMKSMDRDIEQFMDKHTWVFPTNIQRPIGKLSAYMSKIKPLDHHSRL